MASRENVAFAALGELFECLGACGLEQPQAWLDAVSIGCDHRFRDQLCDGIAPTRTIGARVAGRSSSENCRRRENW
jgi:hypothetical protein